MDFCENAGKVGVIVFNPIHPATPTDAAGAPTRSGGDTEFSASVRRQIKANTFNHHVA